MIENAVAYGERASVSIGTGETIVRIVVEDGRPGIDGVEMDRVFEPFVRLEASRSRKTGGAGIGLAIARSVARSHGGEIELENARKVACGQSFPCPARMPNAPFGC